MDMLNRASPEPEMRGREGRRKKPAEAELNRGFHAGGLTMSARVR